MKRDDIIRMAREAGFNTNREMIWINGWEISPYMQRFAALVAAAERATCIAIIENERNFWSHQDAIDVCNLAIDSIRARGQA